MWRPRRGVAACTVSFLLFLTACGETKEPGCEPVGHWRATEQRVSGDCSPAQDEASELLLRVEASADSPRSLDFEVVRGERLLQCSGSASEDACRLELECRDAPSVTEPEPVELGLELDLTRGGAVSGDAELHRGKDPGCRAEFRLGGEKVSPLELPSGLRELE